jgi:VIT1/CCC1 family predicted Fe2+/Mn2+ transporter
MSPTEPPEDRLQQALDQALARVLAAPPVPKALRTRVQAAVLRAGEDALAQARARLEREARAQLAELEQGYLRVRRRTLGTLIGAAFAAGAAVALLMPYLKAQFGANAPLVLAAGGALVGLSIAAGSWLRRADWSELLRD